MFRSEGSGASQLVDLIRAIGHNTDVSIELATVTSEPPELKIKIDNMNIELEKEDLIVAESLTKHKRTVKLKSEGQTTVSSNSPNISFTIGTDTNGKPITLSFSSVGLNSADLTIQEAELEFVNELKKDDRVIVSSINQGQIYIILDRVVVY